MKINALTNTLFALIAIALLAIAARSYIEPPPIQAQSASAYPFYIEPGIQTLHDTSSTNQVYGKVVVDLRNGKIWGFPTSAFNPYPTDPMNNKPVTAHPLYLGQFAFNEIEK